LIIVDIHMKLKLEVLILHVRYHDDTSIAISIICYTHSPHIFITIFFLNKQILLSMTDYCINNILRVHVYQSDNFMIDSL